MPVIMDGFVVVNTRKLADHYGHALVASTPEGVPTLSCSGCATVIEQEHRSTSLPCGCFKQSEHDEGAAIQAKMRKDFRIPSAACVGCYLGDDGPSIHSCYIHS